MSATPPAYSPSALEELLKKMARAAITSSFHEIGWRGTADDGFSADCWDTTLPPVDGPTGTLTVRLRQDPYTQAGLVPPGAVLLRAEHDELLDSTHFVYQLDPWGDIYEPWIDRITTAFEGWEALPDPAEYQDPVDHVRDAVGALTPLPTGAGGSDPEGAFGDAFASVDLAANLAALDGWVGPDGESSSAMLLAFDLGMAPGGSPR
jgi:hypothetical protein